MWHVAEVENWYADGRCHNTAQFSPHAHRAVPCTSYLALIIPFFPHVTASKIPLGFVQNSNQCPNAPQVGDRHSITLSHFVARWHWHCRQSLPQWLHNPLVSWSQKQYFEEVENAGLGIPSEVRTPNRIAHQGMKTIVLLPFCAQLFLAFNGPYTVTMRKRDAQAMDGRLKY